MDFKPVSTTSNYERSLEEKKWRTPPFSNPHHYESQYPDDFDHPQGVIFAGEGKKDVATKSMASSELLSLIQLWTASVKFLSTGIYGPVT